MTNPSETETRSSNEFLTSFQAELGDFFGTVGAALSAMGVSKTGGSPGSFPDVAQTPSPAGPVPVPYPDVDGGRAAEADGAIDRLGDRAEAWGQAMIVGAERLMEKTEDVPLWARDQTRTAWDALKDGVEAVQNGEPVEVVRQQMELAAREFETALEDMGVPGVDLSFDNGVSASF